MNWITKLLNSLEGTDWAIIGIFLICVALIIIGIMCTEPLREVIYEVIK
jgi:hypothetical protein